MPTIQIVDAPCGKGKTSWAIQFMNENAAEDRRFIFITPYIKEADRIKAQCPLLRFRDPDNAKGSKSSHLKDLIDAGENIVSTHSLFSRADAETMELLKVQSYTLILDEVMEVVKQQNISKNDFQMLKDSEYLEVDEKTGKVSATLRTVEYKGQFQDIMNDAKAGRLVCFNGTFLIWQFPPEVFRTFHEVYNLTYMFRGQIQRCYYDYNGIPYEYRTVTGDRNEGYQLGPYDPIEVDRDLRAWAKDNIQIYQGKLNEIGDKWTLGHRWYQDHQNDKRVMKRIRQNTYSFFRRHAKGKAKEAMWTCFKSQKGLLKGNGYTGGFVQCSARATNDYRHKANLAYLVNRFVSPGLIQYFKEKDIKVDQETYALSEMIQWIWRSQVRDGEGIKLYIPSKRMRGLLQAWIDGDL